MVSCKCDYCALVGVRNIVINLSVCVCVSVCEDISGTTGPILTKFCVQIPCGHGSALLWRRCATLCTSSFMDDLTFSRNGHDAETWRLHCAVMAMSGVAILGWSLMSMNACCFCIRDAYTLWLLRKLFALLFLIPLFHHNLHLLLLSGNKMIELEL